MKNPKLWLFVAVLVALTLAARALGLDEALVSGEATARLQALVAAHPALAAGAYLVVSVVCCVLLALPGMVFALVAGIVFGPLWGTLLCWVAVIAGACLAFVAGRHFLKDSLKPKLAQSPALNRLLFEGAASSDVWLLALTRLVPLFPYNLQNFAYGVTDIGFAPYALYSALFLLPGTAAYTVAAAGAVDPSARLQCFVLAGSLLLATLLAAALLKRKAGL